VSGRAVSDRETRLDCRAGQAGDVATAAPSDEQLMLAYREGDREAFDELYARYAKPIYNFLRRIAPRPDAADDLLQKTFLKVHTARHQYRPEGLFRGWIFTLARNVFLDDVRRGHREPTVEAAQFNECIRGKGCDAGPVIGNAEVRLIVAEAIASLPLTQREVIVLSRYQGMSYTEIGDLLGISSNAIKQRAFQAMRKLRQRLSVMEEPQVNDEPGRPEALP